MHAFFNRWQRKCVGRMLTFLLGVVTAVTVCWLLVQLVHAIAFLQPVLIPLAIAGVLSFLLEPLVRLLCANTHRSPTVVDDPEGELRGMWDEIDGAERPDGATPTAPGVPGAV